MKNLPFDSLVWGSLTLAPIIWAAIVAHSKRRTRFTLRRPRLFGTKLAQWILLSEL